ncbi:hypothetical protein Salat_1416300 [Sesamum alatum]|uniref:Uncharacterized protein n=1 Tax=Sesamum alatum TaxID=300844 RepID=A0AAE1YAM6_9LAMI|nr:hypothetical protein Salat_1416300 [Sesamum alatum]
MIIVTTVIRFLARNGNDFRLMQRPYYSAPLEIFFQTIPTGLATLKVPSPETLKVPLICFFFELPSPRSRHRATSKPQRRVIWPSRIILSVSLIRLPAECVDECDVVRFRPSSRIKPSFLWSELRWSGHGGVRLQRNCWEKKRRGFGRVDEEAKQPFERVIMRCNDEAVDINGWWDTNGLLQGSRMQGVKRYAVAPPQSRATT